LNLVNNLQNGFLNTDGKIDQISYSYLFYETN
jgi:hypothetical protein